MSDDLRETSQRKLSFLQTMKAVAWGFFGVRKGAGHREDVAKLNPVHVIVAGLLVGLGTRIGGGCTSGHGVCGTARLSPRSLVATGLFMAAGMAVVALVRHGVAA